MSIFGKNLESCLPEDSRVNISNCFRKRTLALHGPLVLITDKRVSGTIRIVAPLNTVEVSMRFRGNFGRFIALIFLTFALPLPLAGAFLSFSSYEPPFVANVIELYIFLIGHAYLLILAFLLIWGLTLRHETVFRVHDSPRRRLYILNAPYLLRFRFLRKNTAMRRFGQRVKAAQETELAPTSESLMWWIGEQPIYGALQSTFGYGFLLFIGLLLPYVYTALPAYIFLLCFGPALYFTISLLYAFVQERKEPKSYQKALHAFRRDRLKEARHMAEETCVHTHDHWRSLHMLLALALLEFDLALAKGYLEKLLSVTSDQSTCEYFKQDFARIEALLASSNN